MKKTILMVVILITFLAAAACENPLADIVERDIAMQWHSDTVYSTGDRTVYLTVSYESLRDGNVGHVPDGSPEWWGR